MSTFSIEGPLQAWIARNGRTLKVKSRGSGLQVVLAEMDGERVYFEQAQNATAARGLERVVNIYQAVTHACLPPLWGFWSASDGPTLVYKAVPAERVGPRFLELPLWQREHALEKIFELHSQLAARGFVSCGFNQRSLLYDFERQQIYLTRLQQYRGRPFRLWTRQPTTTFSAPEEKRQGGRLDQRTTVFHLGKAAALLLGESGEHVDRATRESKRHRFSQVSQFVLTRRRLKKSLVPAPVSAEP